MKQENNFIQRLEQEKDVIRQLSVTVTIGILILIGMWDYRLNALIMFLLWIPVIIGIIRFYKLSQILRWIDLEEHFRGELIKDGYYKKTKQKNRKN